LQGLVNLFAQLSGSLVGAGFLAGMFGCENDLTNSLGSNIVAPNFTASQVWVSHLLRKRSRFSCIRAPSLLFLHPSAHRPLPQALRAPALAACPASFPSSPPSLCMCVHLFVSQHNHLAGLAGTNPPRPRRPLMTLPTIPFFPCLLAACHQRIRQGSTWRNIPMLEAFMTIEGS